MEIKRFESSFLEPTVYLFGCKSDNENVSRPTFQLSQSIEIPRDYSPLIFESNSISFTLLSSYEIDHSPFRNFCIRVPRSIARFFFRKRIIYIRTIVLCFTFPNLQRGYKIICISIDVSPRPSARVSCSRKRGSTIRDYASLASLDCARKRNLRRKFSQRTIDSLCSLQNFIS